MEIILSFIYDIVKNPHFLLMVLSLSIIIKTYYLGRVVRKIYNEQSARYPLLFLSLYITSTIVGDLSWFMKLVQNNFIEMPYYIVVFFIRGGWGFLVLQYYALALFLESFTNTQFRFSRIHLPITIIAATFSSYFFLIMLLQPFTLATKIERNIALEHINGLEFFIMRYVIYLIGIFTIIGIYRTYKNIKRRQLPKIIRKQLHLFTWFIIVPYLAVEFSCGFSFNSVNEMQATVSILTLLLSMAVYYCLYKVLKLRFINTAPRVQEQPKPHVLGHFKAALEQLSNTQSMQELIHVTQHFFKETFFVAAQSVHLVIRDHQYLEENQEVNRKTKHLDIFINHHLIHNSIQMHQPIFVYDEIDFNYFYDESAENAAVLQFLKQANADIFLPIASHKHPVGAIIIEKNSRSECFSHNEQDAMIAFANYLGNIINLLHNKNLDSLISKKKKLQDQLYIKHQEINHYKESIQTFLRHTKEKAFGIIFYKNDRFIHGNRDAAKIVQIDLNMQEGHPLTQAFKHVVYHVQTYNSPYNHSTYDVNGLPLILSGVFHLQQQSIIITVSYPEISDIIMQQIYQLHNPTDWDYLLYLSSTKTGSLINELIPSSGETILNIKISLLKAALNKKTLLLDVADPDIPSIIQLLHTASDRDTIHTIELTEPVKSPDIVALIFGNTLINPHHEPLLKTLDGGTLFIKNVHFLDKTSQEYLVEYIISGLCRIYNTDQKIPTNTRIICSSNQNIMHCVQEGTFSAKLCNLLKQATIKIPSLITLPAPEMRNLIEGYADKIITTHPMKNLFTPTEKEKQKIIELQPNSLKELRNLVEHVIMQKSHAVNIEFDNGSPDQHTDADVIEAARLGKQALKHPKLLKKLWQKFRNQNKIALFLGVNRSSVNRRCKLYDIGDESQGMA
jgi:transcriptional regulator with GAF, ATPase, and Fis domain